MYVCVCVCVCVRARARPRVHMHARNFEALLTHQTSMQLKFLPLGIDDGFASINGTITSS